MDKKSTKKIALKDIITSLNKTKTQTNFFETCSEIIY